MQQIGILGGTFDPIHNGHLAIAAEVHWRLGLERVIFVPAGHQPLKPRGHCASAEDRLAMTRLATADNPAFVVSDWEVARPGPSYTVDTMEALGQVWPAAQLFFIIGADAVASLPRWYQIGRLLTLCRLVVVGRPGWHIDPDVQTRLDPAHAWVPVEGPALDISATNLRVRRRSGAPIRYQVPEAVHAYIEAHHLYEDCL